MPMSIPWDEHALKYLISPPPPSHPLRDIILNVRTSMDINALAMLGRNVLRCCVIARTYHPPITQDFEEKIDARLEDVRLARIARETGLLERLKVHEVATDTTDVAHILCAYVGATLRCGWVRTNTNQVDNSVNDICSKILDEDEDPVVLQNNSHERMMLIDGIQMMPTSTPVKPEPTPSVPAPTPTRAVRIDLDANSNESVSSGRSPPPHMYGAHYQHPFQPYYPPNPANPPPPPPHPMQHIHHQTIPQRYGSYAQGPVHSSSPAFGQSGPGMFPPGQGAYPQAQYQPAQYASPPPQGIPIPPQSNGIPSGSWGPQPPQNPPGYTMPPQPPQPPAPAPMPTIPPVPPQQTQGFISLFNELAMKHRMTTSWQQQKTGQQHIPEWTMWLLVDGTPRGHGTASTKQSAKEIAARAALQAMGWLAA